MNKVPAMKTVHKMKKHSTVNLFPALKKFPSLKAFSIVMCMAVMLLTLSGCAEQANSPADEQTAAVEADSPVPKDSSIGASGEEAVQAVTDTPVADQNETEDQMRLLIGETEVPVTWKDNASVEALRALCPLTIHMSMYGGFEQVGAIGQSIPRDDRQTDTSYGDIVLYSGNQIVIFYGSNSWAYTKLGHVDLSQKEMRDLLSNGDVDITLK